MDAKKCDRCGRFYINVNDSTTTGLSYTNVSRLYLAKFISTSARDMTMDLCHDCRHDLDEWFNKFKKEENDGSL